MSLSVLIPLSLLLGLIGLVAFVWALWNGQFDDPDGDAWRVIAPQVPHDNKGAFHDQLASDTQDDDTGGGL